MNYKLEIPLWLKPTSNKNLIRLGRWNDGGYLVPFDIIQNKKKLVSFGINDDWSFEKDFLNLNKDSHIYLFDKSVSYSLIVRNFIKNILHLPNYFPLLNSFIALFTFHIFFKKKNVHFYPLFVGRTVIGESKSFSQCLEISNAKNEELVVKIDIEGSEYRILDDLISNKNYFSLLIVEFHDIDIHLNVLKKFLEDLDFEIIHLHVNNYSKPDINGLPKDIELTIQKKSGLISDNNEDYPLEQDMPSNNLIHDLPIKWV